MIKTESGGCHMVTREMYMGYLSTIDNDNCYNSGPLSAQNAY